MPHDGAGRSRCAEGRGETGCGQCPPARQRGAAGESEGKMVRSPYAEIVCIIDRSGSMESIRQDAIGGFNRFMDEQKKLPGDARLTLVLFNDEYALVADGAPLSRFRPLDDVVRIRCQKLLRELQRYNRFWSTRLPTDGKRGYTDGQVVCRRFVRKNYFSVITALWLCADLT